MAYLEGRFRRAPEGSGEHTGYILEVEVETTDVENLGELEGEQIAMTGDVRLIDFPERGKILIFKAVSGAAIESDEDFE